MAGPVAIEWSLDALDDLDRFAAFLREAFPQIAARVAAEIMARAEILQRHPRLGRPLAGRQEYREIILQVAGGAYQLQYRYEGTAILMLRVFHSRETK